MEAKCQKIGPNTWVFCSCKPSSDPSFRYGIPPGFALVSDTEVLDISGTGIEAGLCNAARCNQPVFAACETQEYMDETDHRRITMVHYLCRLHTIIAICRTCDREARIAMMPEANRESERATYSPVNVTDHKNTSRN